MIQMTWLTFRKIMWLFNWIISLSPFLTYVNKISWEPLVLGLWFWLTDCVQGVDDLINFWQISVNIWLNYLPFPTLAFCTVKQSHQQSIWWTALAGIMTADILFGYIIQMTWLTFRKIMWLFNCIIPLFPLMYCKPMGPCQQSIWRTALARNMIFETQILSNV